MLDSGGNFKESKQSADTPESKSSSLERVQNIWEKVESKISEMFSDDYIDNFDTKTSESSENTEIEEKRDSNENKNQNNRTFTFKEKQFEKLFADDFLDNLKQSHEKIGNNNSEIKTRTPENNGKWEGDRGNSKWYPNPDYVPPEKSRNPEDRPYSNPDNLSWGEILKKYGIDGIVFKDGFPVFDDISRGTVEIDDFETGGNDAKNRNFKKADIAMAEQRGCTPEEVEKWREENNYTWHECEDKRTMQKVPNEVHANVPHDGGRSQ